MSHFIRRIEDIAAADLPNNGMLVARLMALAEEIPFVLYDPDRTVYAGELMEELSNFRKDGRKALEAAAPELTVLCRQNGNPAILMCLAEALTVQGEKTPLMNEIAHAALHNKKNNHFLEDKEGLFLRNMQRAPLPPMPHDRDPHARLEVIKEQLSHALKTCNDLDYGWVGMLAHRYHKLGGLLHGEAYVRGQLQAMAASVAQESRLSGIHIVGFTITQPGNLLATDDLLQSVGEAIDFTLRHVIDERSDIQKMFDEDRLRAAQEKDQSQGGEEGIADEIKRSRIESRLKSGRFDVGLNAATGKVDTPWTQSVTDRLQKGIQLPPKQRGE